jgi:glyoxylase-like metal-dependent hydrolase (beta-lactamase superfamily II)
VIRIVRVLAPNPGPFTLDGTNTWIVGENPAIVIDPGPDDAGHLLAVMDAAGPIAEVLVTHDHPDHQPGAERLAETLGTAYRAHRPGPRGERLHDGEEIVAGQARLRAVFTPGHAADHVSFHLQAEAALFTGDAVLGRGTSVIDPPEGDLAAYLRSLAAMLALDPRTIYPGHGPAVFGAVAKLREYVEHRALREQQVLEALRDGPKTPEEIVPGIYTDEVPEAMFPAAARSVLAHLLKLEREGRALHTRPASANRFEAAEVRACERCGRPALPRSRLCPRCSMALLQESPAPAGE